MLLKLHNYFNWADKKLHTAFFIENKESINEDLLADFKEGADLNVNPGLASNKTGKVAENKPAGFRQNEMSFINNRNILRQGSSIADLVDVTSHNDFPTLGSQPTI